MYLVRLIYTSTITEKFNHDDISQILEAARRNNGKHDITGILCFNNDQFLQCLEGSRKQVNRLYQAILQDSRHGNILLLKYHEIVSRAFDDWSMGYVPESSLTAPAIRRHSGHSNFNPYEMSGNAAEALLISLKDTVPTHS